MNNAMFRPDPPAKKPLGARESDLDRLQSALERADHPRPPSSVPMSQGFDINSYLLELDTGGGLDSLRRTSGSTHSLDLGTPQQPMMQQPFQQIPQPLPGFASLPQQHFLQQQQQQPYFGQPLPQSPGMQGMQSMGMLPPFGMPQQQLPQQRPPPQQAVMSAPSPMLLPEFSFNPASPAMFSDTSSLEQQHAPALPTISSILREFSAPEPGVNASHLGDAHHAPAEKTLSAIVREMVNDQTMVPPRDPSAMDF